MLAKIRAGTTSARVTSRQAYPALLLGGCKDVEVSYDASFTGRPNGAMTFVALEALKKKPATPKDWYQLIRKQLPSVNYPQTPQLYGSRTAKAGAIF